MNKVDLPGVVAMCRQAESFLVTSHTSPDGDAIGSMLAMRFFLNALGKSDVTCTCHDPVPRMYDWVPGAIEIVDPELLRAAYDLVVILDVAQRERIGSVAQHLGPEQAMLVLDHHPETEPCGTHGFIDPTYAASAEIVVDLFETAGIAIPLEAAIAAYVGLTTDTGSFRFGNTDARAHRHAATLIDAGVDPAEVAARVFDVMSFPKYDLLKRVLDRIERSDCERYAWSYLTERDLEQADADQEDVEGLVNFVRNLEGIEVGMLFRELKPKKIKVSMRSRRGVHAGHILNPLGGGGHAGAAGAILHMPLDEAMRVVRKRVADTLGEPVPPSPVSMGAQHG